MEPSGPAILDTVISTLNNLHVGDLDRIAQHLAEVHETLTTLHHNGLAQLIREAQQAIKTGNAPLFRRRIQHVVSRLGHLRTS